MYRSRWLSLVLGAVSLMASESFMEKQGTSFASPQEVWDAYRFAQNAGRWRELFRCVTPQAQQRFIQGIVFATAHLERTPERDKATKLRAVLKDNGLDVEEIETVAGDSRNADYVNKLIARLKDRERLFDEAMIVMDDTGISSKGEGKDRGITLGELKSVEITGDRARGKCMKRLDDRESFDIGGVRQPEVELEIEFQRISGRWFVHEGG